MKFTARLFSLVLFLLTLCAFGFAHIAEHYGPPMAALAFIGLLFAAAPRISPVLGVATTIPILTDEREGIFRFIPLAAATSIPAGVIVAIDAAGRALNAADTAGLRVQGRAEESVNNSAGAAGDLSINIKRGCFKYQNSATNPITAAMLGRTAYVEDNQTVASTSANLVVAGRVMGVDADGVWINTLFASLASGLVATSANGVAAAASANLANLAAETEKIGDDVRAVIARLNG